MQKILSLSNPPGLIQQIAKAPIGALFSSIQQKSDNESIQPNILQNFSEILSPENSFELTKKEQNSIEIQQDDDDELLKSLSIEPMKIENDSNVIQVFDEAIKINDKIDLLDNLKEEAQKSIIKQAKYFAKKAISFIGQNKKPLIIGTCAIIAATGIYKILQNKHIISCKENNSQQIKQLKLENSILKEKNKKFVEYFKKQREKQKFIEKKISELETEKKENMKEIQEYKEKQLKMEQKIQQIETEKVQKLQQLESKFDLLLQLNSKKELAYA